MRTLRQRSDFQDISRKGRQVRPCSWLVLAYRSNSEGQFRFGWTIPRYVGVAVVRNRFRRWCREYFRNTEHGLEATYDINVVFRRKDKEFYKNVRHEEVFEILDRAVSQMGKRCAHSG
ncbi:MAG: ribonuclease P protein component [Bdellovibrionales bacterium]|nr:ribonuclease P protein component [Bdellovibrionales bacterium]